MKRIAACILPLWLVTVAWGTDLHIDRTNEYLRVWTTNNTFWYCRFEYNTTLSTNGWKHYRTFFGEPGEIAVYQMEFLIKTNLQRNFWRLKDGPLP